VTAWDDSFDLVIVGSGGGAFAAALAVTAAGKKPLIVEKQSKVGGSTALSGGVLWVPNNSLMRKAGVEDSFADALAYMKRISDYSGPATDPVRQEAFLRGGVGMVDFFLSQGIKLDYVPGWADYYSDGHPRGRLVSSALVDTKPLGAWKAKLQTGSFSLPINSSEGSLLPLAKRTLKGFITGAKFTVRMKLDAWRGSPRYGMGTGIMAQMLNAALKRGVPIWTDTRVTDLVSENGRVVGVAANREGKEIRVQGRDGVLIAAGGFARNAELRRKYLPQPAPLEWTVANEGDTGDMVGPVMRLGAAIELMDAAVWCPGTMPPNFPAMFCTGNLTKPYSILVDRTGQRFCNEASSYHNVVMSMYRRNQTVPAIPAWLIMDSRHLEYYPFIVFPPGTMPPEFVRSGYVKKSDSIEGLASQCGIDPAALKRTVDRIGEFARSGVDTDFHRGEWHYDRYYGDPRIAPNPNIAAIDRGPFYAVEIIPSDGGVMGGFSTDQRARVVNRDGSVIPGLYASGTAAASVFGHGYPCSGGALSVSFVWGYVAGRDAAGAA
jgi:3-oxosteroid 1-dehydrogenase